MRTSLVSCLMVLSGAAASAEGGHECPLAAASRKAQVDHRHEDTTRVPSTGTEHHFALTDDGGTITLEATADDDAEARVRVREHLRTIARAFAEGDFSMPEAIHERVPPGVETLKARRSAMRYRFAETPRGGVVTIATTDAEALAAVHAFLRFQIDDHATGDPTPR
jgi:tRNA threonylcarbamoyladenosine modification (KEOPS) complex  Pcc1 subunit